MNYPRIDVKVYGKAAFVTLYQNDVAKSVMTDRAGLQYIRDTIDHVLANPMSNENGKTVDRIR